tara:strand:+ start:291 stop:695 length:405 start_codon:yes stop_codon:yes gene_type:complete
MAKESGFGMSVTVDDAGGTGRDISNDITNVDFETPRNIQDITGLDKSATERLLLLADFSATLNGVFNATSNKSHDVFKLWATTTVARTTSIVHSGQTLAVEVWVLDYAVARADSGEMTWGTPMVLQDGAVPTWA